MDLPLHEDDLDEPGLIDALRMHRRGQVAPVAVLCFFNELLNELANEGVLTPVYHLRSEIGHNPVYEMDVPGGSVAVVHPGVGAPLEDQLPAMDAAVAVGVALLARAVPLIVASFLGAQGLQTC